MEAIKLLKGVAIPLPRDDVDTDRLIPIRFLRKPLSDGYGNFLLADDRFDESGQEKPDFVFNHPVYRRAPILVSGKNFGCGSAREGAVYAVKDFGIRVVIAEGFSDIFRMNCCWNGILPVVLQHEEIQAICTQLLAVPGTEITVDLERQQVLGPDNRCYTFEIDQAVKQRLLAGLDEIGVTRQFQDRIDKFEQQYVSVMPWIAAPGSTPHL